METAEQLNRFKIFSFLSDEEKKQLKFFFSVNFEELNSI
jgi:hypothetical protein